ncbi:MAG: enoyl-CoA hydratase/isomerase family protein [Acidimicrobiia bacterium]
MSSSHNRNALSLRMLDGIADAARAAATDAGCRGLVIDHDGDVFSAGVDLVERRALHPGARNHSEALAELYAELWRFPKPLIARVAGPVRGGGLGLIVCADMVVATSAASFAFSEVRIGVPPALVGALTMAKLGSDRMSQWLLTGAVFGPDEARDCGLVHRVAGGDGCEELDGWVRAITAAGPSAVMTTKGLTRRFVLGDVDGLIGEMRQVSADAFESEEAKEGMAAFADKRPPSWST